MEVYLLKLLIAFAAGFVLGFYYFGGLWWTIRKLPNARQPALLTIGSFVARTGITLLGLFLASGGRWERILVGLLGFLVARGLLVRRFRPTASIIPQKKGARP